MKPTNYLIAFCLLAILVDSKNLNAQYFGQNKVLHEKFEFQVMQTPHFDIHYYASTEKIIPDIALMAEGWYSKYSKILDHTFVVRKPLIIYADHPDFQQTQAVSDLIDPGVSGVTEGLKSRLIMPLAESYSSTNHVLGHEMVHVFQYDMLIQNDSLSMESIYNLPLWMIEGLAEYLSLGEKDELTDVWMRDAVMHNNLPTLHQVSVDMNYFPYRYGHSIWTFICNRWGNAIIKPLFIQSATYGFESAIFSILDITEDSLSAGWHQWLQEKYAAPSTGFVKADSTGVLLVGPKLGGGELNISPVLSPDGKYFIFLSEKDLFSVDLYLAETSTGKIVRKLSSSVSNNHYDALSFVQYSGTWSPDNKTIAFTVIKQGDHKILLFDINKRRVTKIIGFENVGAIYGIDWSPDGTQLAFSGSNGGMTDLFVYNLITQKLRQLTNDFYSDMQPAWSPDGKSIAFCTDRKNENDAVKPFHQNLKIAFINCDNNQITMMPEFKKAKHINPIYSPDGSSVYFLSNKSGISTIYRYEFATGEYFVLSNLSTGICGLTEQSSSLSVAKKTGEIIYSVFDATDYSIYKLKSKTIQPLTYPELKITDQKDTLALPETPDTALIADIKEESKFSVSSYKPRLSLDYIGNVYAGVSVGGYGGGFVGGISLLFSDLLSEHNLYSVIQANGSVKDIGALIAYLNTRNRFQWGAMISHIPYASGTNSESEDSIQYGGKLIPVSVIDQNILRAFDDRIAFIARYPLSLINRFDFNAGYSYLSYHRELYRTITTPDYMQVLDEKKQKLDAPPAVQLANVAAAFVGDNAYFGYTSPLAGFRYRFEIEANAGTYNYLNLLLDYRYYKRVKPVTFAFRAMHYGRYLGDSESNWLAPINLGDEYFMRGYSMYSFDYSECSGAENGKCPEFERLLGSKIGTFNFEIRLPFTGNKRLALIKSRFLFTSLNAFFEGGIAWWNEELPHWNFITKSTLRVPVFSTGLSLRINLFNALVLELYAAHPFQRPEKKIVFGLVILPGW